MSRGVFVVSQPHTTSEAPNIPQTLPIARLMSTHEPPQAGFTALGFWGSEALLWPSGGDSAFGRLGLIAACANLLVWGRVSAEDLHF